MLKVFSNVDKGDPLTNNRNKTISSRITKEVINEVVKGRRKRDNEDSLYTLTARAYDLGKLKKIKLSLFSMLPVITI